jgi:hypothetical protein
MFLRQRRWRVVRWYDGIGNGRGVFVDFIIPIVGASTAVVSLQRQDLRRTNPRNLLNFSVLAKRAILNTN